MVDAMPPKQQEKKSTKDYNDNRRSPQTTGTKRPLNQSSPAHSSSGGKYPRKQNTKTFGKTASSAVAATSSSSQKASNQELLQCREQRKSLERDLKKLEKQILDLERNYLRSSPGYNIAEGFAMSVIQNKRHAALTKDRISPKDCIVSSSSLTSPLFAGVEGRKQALKLVYGASTKDIE